MKKRLIVLTAMMLCIIMMLSSCALFKPTVKFKNLVEKDFAPETNPTLTKVDKLNIQGAVQTSNDGNYYTSSDNLVLLIDTDKDTGRDTFTVYNVATNQVILEETESKKVEFSVDFKNLYVENKTVTLVLLHKVGNPDSDVEYELTVLTETGKKVVELEGESQSAVTSDMWNTADLFCIQNKVYRISENGEANVAFDWSDLRKNPGYLEKFGDFYISTSSSLLSVAIYDNSLSLLKTYTAPQYDSEAESEVMVNPLANGNVLVQYLVRQDSMAEKYTLLLNGEKYNLYSVLIEAKSGKVKDLNLDCVIAQVAGGDILSEIGINEKVKNIARAYAIEDKRIDTSEEAMLLITLTNQGKVEGVLDSPVPGALLSEGFEAVAKNRWLFRTVKNSSFLVDEKGKIVGEASNIAYSNNAYIVSQGHKIYDYDLNMKLDLKEEGSTYIYMFENSVLFYTDKSEVKLYVNGEVKTIINASEGKRTFTKLSNGAYMITDTTGSNTTYEIYNEQGTLLGTIEDKLQTPPTVVKTADNGALLIAAQNQDSSEVKYYRVG